MQAVSFVVMISRARRVAALPHDRGVAGSVIDAALAILFEAPRVPAAPPVVVPARPRAKRSKRGGKVPAGKVAEVGTFGCAIAAAMRRFSISQSELAELTGM